MQPPRLLIGGAAHHHAVDVLEMARGLLDARDAAIDRDVQRRIGALEPIDAVVVERRDIAVLARREPVEPGFARMHDQRIGAGRDHGAGERVERLFRVLLVDADAALHRDRQRDRGLHGGDAIADQRRLGHQAGAEAPFLHAVRRAADIEVDLGVAEVGADARALGERLRVRAAELHRDRLLGRIEARAAAPGRRAAPRRW